MSNPSESNTDLDSEEHNACQFVTISLLSCQVRYYLLNGEGGEVLHNEFGILSVQQHLIQPAPPHFTHQPSPFLHWFCCCSINNMEILIRVHNIGIDRSSMLLGIVGWIIILHYRMTSYVSIYVIVHKCGRMMVWKEEMLSVIIIEAIDSPESLKPFLPMSFSFCFLSCDACLISLTTHWVLTLSSYLK